MSRHKEREMTDNVVDMDEWVQRKVDEVAAHESWEQELTVAVAHSVAHLYVEKVLAIYEGASESFVIYSILQGLMGRVSHMLAEGDPGAPGILGWLDYISNSIADGTGVSFDDASMDEAMGHIYAHRLGEPMPTQEGDQ